MTEQELTRQFPWIPWREPMPVSLMSGGADRLACRICIALDGMKASDIFLLPLTREEFAEHMRTMHPEGLPQ